MPDPITIQELQDASRDADDLEKFVNGAADINGTGLIPTRFNGSVPSLRKVIQDSTVSPADMAKVEEAIEIGEELQAQLANFPLAYEPIWLDLSIVFQDKYGFVSSGITIGGDFYGDTTTNLAGSEVIAGLQSFGFAVSDRYGFIRDYVGGPSAVTMQIVEAMNAKALAYASQRRAVNTLEIAAPTADWNIIIGYGQSLGQGQEAWPALTTVADTAGLSLFMLGDAEKPQSETATSWVPFGTAALNPLKATVIKAGAILTAPQQAALPVADQALGESPSISAAIVARKMWLSHLGVTDDDRSWIVGSCGVGGTSIEQLSYGASENYFNRMVDFVTRVKALADSLGKTVKIIGIVYMQGEYNAVSSIGGSKDRAFNLAARQQMRSDIQQYVCGIVGQTERPAWIEYQTSGFYIDNDAAFGVQMAQLDMLNNNRTRAFGSQPSFPVPDKNGHLDPNGSRWIGCMIGRSLGHVLTQRRAYWPLTPFEVKHSGRSIYVSHLVPQAPLVFKEAWVGSAMAKTIYDNKGFTISDDNGAAPVLSVDIVSDTVVRISSNRDFVGTPTIRLGGPATAGNHNLFDSDPTIFPLSYLYSAGNGQYAAANVAELLNLPYSAQSAAYSYQIQSTPYLG